ncbi:MAG: hypothetical protein WC464_06670 [Bdellovibrionales bacterium]
MDSLSVGKNNGLAKTVECKPDVLDHVTLVIGGQRIDVELYGLAIPPSGRFFRWKQRMERRLGYSIDGSAFDDQAALPAKNREDSLYRKLDDITKKPKMKVKPPSRPTNRHPGLVSLGSKILPDTAKKLEQLLT